MSQLFNGSIYFTDLSEQAKIPHSAFARGKNKKAYVNVEIWINDEPDQYGNHLQIKLKSAKDAKDKDQKVYVGNAKKSTFGQSEPKNEKPDPFNAPIVNDDLPF